MAIEWYDLDSHATLSVADHGEEIGEHQVDKEAAIVFVGDEASVMEGSIEQLLEQLRQAVTVLEGMQRTREGTR